MKSPLFLVGLLSLSTLNATDCRVSVDNFLEEPIASDLTLTLVKFGGTAGQLIATDPNFDSLTYRIIRAPYHGTVDLDLLSGEFTYFPHSSSSSPDSFEFLASDKLYDSNVAQVTLLPANNSWPVALNLSLGVAANSSVIEHLPATDSDGDSLHFEILQQPQAGTITFLDSSTGRFRYRPYSNTVGEDYFTYRVSDGQGGSAQAEVNVNIY